MLSKYLDKIKYLAAERKTDLLIALILVFANSASFGLGRLSAVWPEKQPVTVENYGKSQQGNAKTSEKLNLMVAEDPSTYIASKTGKSYHYPWCVGAKSIKEENKIWFKTKEDAEKAGYHPAGNCPGL